MCLGGSTLVRKQMSRQFMQRGEQVDVFGQTHFGEAGQTGRFAVLPDLERGMFAARFGDFQVTMDPSAVDQPASTVL